MVVEDRVKVNGQLGNGGGANNANVSNCHLGVNIVAMEHQQILELLDNLVVDLDRQVETIIKDLVMVRRICTVFTNIITSFFN